MRQDHRNTTSPTPESRDRYWCEFITDDEIDRAIRYAESRVSFVFWRGRSSILRAVRSAIVGIVLDLDGALRERAGKPDDKPTPTQTRTLLRVVPGGGR